MKKVTEKQVEELMATYGLEASGLMADLKRKGHQCILFSNGDALDFDMDGDGHITVEKRYISYNDPGRYPPPKSYYFA